MLIGPTGVYGERAPRILAWMFCAAAFSMPLKMALVTASFSLLALAAAIFHLMRAPRNVVARMGAASWFAVALFAWAFLRCLGGVASIGSSFAALWDLHELAVLPLLVAIPLAVDHRDQAIRAFVAGNLVAAGVSYGRLLGWLPITRDPPLMYEPPQGPIAGAWMMTLAVFLCVLAARRASGWGRAAWFFATAAMLGVLLFLTAGRTGYLSLIALTALAASMLSRRQTVIMLIVLFSAAGSSWFISPVMRLRVVEIFEPAQGALANSTAHRREIYRVASATAMDSPLPGHGTGSFGEVYEKAVMSAGSPAARVGNPHNEFLYLWIELGVVGVALFVGMLAAAWRQARSLDETSEALVKALVLTMAIASLFNSFLHDAAPGRTFVLLLALALAPRAQRLVAHPASGVRP